MSQLQISTDLDFPIIHEAICLKLEVFFMCLKAYNAG